MVPSEKNRLRDRQIYHRSRAYATTLHVHGACQQFAVTTKHAKQNNQIWYVQHNYLGAKAFFDLGDKRVRILFDAVDHHLKENENCVAHMYSTTWNPQIFKLPLPSCCCSTSRLASSQRLLRADQRDKARVRRGAHLRVTESETCP